MSECDAITKIKILSSLQIVDWKRASYPEAEFLLHSKDEDKFLIESVGKSHKGMNRMLRKLCKP